MDEATKKAIADDIAERNKILQSDGYKLHMNLGQQLVQEQLSRMEPRILVVGGHPLSVFGHPGIGKSYHIPVPTGRIYEYGKATVVRNPFAWDDLPIPICPIEDDDRKLPEWQKRRKQSQDAKQAMIDKLKAKRR